MFVGIQVFGVGDDVCVVVDCCQVGGVCVLYVDQVLEVGNVDVIVGMCGIGGWQYVVGVVVVVVQCFGGVIFQEY